MNNQLNCVKHKEKILERGKKVLDFSTNKGEDAFDNEERESSFDEKVTALLIEPGKSPSVIKLGTDLSDLQNAVGGFIEVIYPFDDDRACIICNEEGKINGMELNRSLYDRDGYIVDIIAGPFVVIGLDLENFTSLTKEQIEKYRIQFLYPEYFKYVGDRLAVFYGKP